MQQATRYLHICAISLIICCILSSVQTAHAQTSSVEWSLPQLIYRSEHSIDSPTIVADADGIVHAFWTEASSAQSTVSFPITIFHSELREGVWSRPTDVLAAPDSADATAPEVTADRYGRLHMLFHGANNTLYYSVVDAKHAGEVMAWSYPIAIATAWYNPGIVVDDAGVIHVAYPGIGNQGVYYTRSTDGGSTWSDGTTIATPASTDASPDYTQIAVDKQGGLHVVWAEFQLPDGAPALGVYYAHSYDEGQTWSLPIRMVSGPYVSPMLKIDPTGGLHIVWNGAVVVGGRFYSHSEDRGMMWSAPVAVVAQKIGGSSGYADFVSDSAGVLHVTTSIGPEIMYISRQKNTWTAPRKVSGTLTGLESRSVERPRITISQGNRLYAIFENGFKEIYVITAHTSAPAIASTAIPVTSVPILATDIPIVNEREQVATVEKSLNAPTVDASGDNTASLLSGLLPVTGLIAIIALVKWMRSRA